MKEFILENYELLILVGACILDVVLFIFGVLKRKKCSTQPLESVLFALPTFINDVEKEVGAGNGESKKLRVVNEALNFYWYLTGLKVSQTSYIAQRISEEIEKILSTPQKKG